MSETCWLLCTIMMSFLRSASKYFQPFARASVPVITTSSDENDGSAITILPLYFGLMRSVQVLGRSAAGRRSSRT